MFLFQKQPLVVLFSRLFGISAIIVFECLIVLVFKQAFRD